MRSPTKSVQCTSCESADAGASGAEARVGGDGRGGGRGRDGEEHLCALGERGGRGVDRSHDHDHDHVRVHVHVHVRIYGLEDRAMLLSLIPRGWQLVCYLRRRMRRRGVPVRRRSAEAPW